MTVLNFFILLTLITTISADDPAINSTTVENITQNTPITTYETTVTATSDSTTTVPTTSRAETAGDTVGDQKSTTEPSDRENQTETKVTNQPEAVAQLRTSSTIETATCALDQPHVQPSPREATSKEATPKEATPKGATPEETTPEKNDHIVATSEKAIPDDTTPAMTEPPRKPSLLQRMKFHGQHNHLSSSEESGSAEGRPTGPVPCTCGVFLSGQFKKGSKQPPKGLPVLTQEMDTPFMNNAMGNRQCTNKCLELIIKHLPKSGEIICATVDREHVFKERAYLFIKNHSDKWHGTNLSAGREFCCRENMPYKCPVN